jgi:hypothetical protein
LVFSKYQGPPVRLTEAFFEAATRIETNADDGDAKE